MDIRVFAVLRLFLLFAIVFSEIMLSAGDEHHRYMLDSPAERVCKNI